MSETEGQEEQSTTGGGEESSSGGPVTGGSSSSGSGGVTLKNMTKRFNDIIAEQDEQLRISAKILTEDMKYFTQIAKKKVKTIQEKRRQKQQLPSTTNLIQCVNQGAGSEILTHYKEKWNHIHSDTNASSALCDEMYQSLQKLYGSMSNSHHIITMATEELSGLPDVLKNIEETSNKIGSIEEMLRKVEESIVECIRTGEVLETERKKHSLKLQLKRHKEEKEREVQKLEARVQEEKSLTLERQAKLEEAAHRERQEALDTMFKQQMSEYIEKGSVEKPILSDDELRDRSLSELSVERVNIEDTEGDEELKEFLSDTEGTNEETKEKQEEEEEN
ncbi:PREDICTED: restin homolog [Amphimedon queenslandica]|uniref:Dysbindin n=1 Tax=Amphimedon queenslandica TaxID=400682 RepID=A0A1X7V014_AMPQE|nr:PREDICTED: restin homolog [Amphimedon queenslandica]|eukprot:XP_011403697.1 PREDICTED: restin homolog [Amphimedon queenslandica]